MKKKKINKMTKFEPAHLPVGLNQHQAASYGEWCEAEAERIGGGAYVHTEERSGIIFCRIDKPAG